MTRARARWLLGVTLALASAGCAALKPGPGGSSEELIGLTARLSARSGPALALAVDGAVSGRPAVIRIDIASPLLMRSRVVLGEKEVAATAFRKALEVFKDDTAASDKIAAAATELGLKAE